MNHFTPAQVKRMAYLNLKDARAFNRRVDTDPRDLERRIAEYRAWLELKRAGRLKPYVGTLMRKMG